MPIVKKSYLQDNRATGMIAVPPFYGDPSKDAWKDRAQGGYAGVYVFDGTDQGKPRWDGGTDTERAPVSFPNKRS